MFCIGIVQLTSSHAHDSKYWISREMLWRPWTQADEMSKSSFRDRLTTPRLHDFLRIIIFQQFGWLVWDAYFSLYVFLIAPGVSCKFRATSHLDDSSGIKRQRCEAAIVTSAGPRRSTSEDYQSWRQYTSPNSTSIGGKSEIGASCNELFAKRLYRVPDIRLVFGFKPVFCELGRSGWGPWLWVGRHLRRYVRCPCVW